LSNLDHLLNVVQGLIGISQFDGVCCAITEDHLIGAIGGDVVLKTTIACVAGQCILRCLPTCCDIVYNTARVVGQNTF
jgi:hypothetical protein